ncbi:MAG: FKBP-type peptidyl-prolyl cis-trans isomerase [Ketobacteraceae bacterium]|nr:FKBP-type peptidyl-prolyl cis-trans isomerase [Ketobacteraceae bacterium]
MKTIAEGSRVRLNFVLRFSDGVFVDSNEGLEPVEVVVGDGILLDAVEQALLGKTKSERIRVTIEPEQGYGYADPSLIVETPLSDIPEASRHPGAAMTAYDEEGEQKVVMVTEINGDTAKVDFNHPYAGRTLCYDIDIVDVK